MRFLHFTPLKLLFLYDIIWCNFVFIYYCLSASLECKLSEVRLNLPLIPRAYNSVCTEYVFSSGWASQILQQSININPQLTSPQSNNILQKIKTKFSDGKRHIKMKNICKKSFLLICATHLFCTLLIYKAQLWMLLKKVRRELSKEFIMNKMSMYIILDNEKI